MVKVAGFDCCCGGGWLVLIVVVRIFSGGYGWVLVEGGCVGLLGREREREREEKHIYIYIYINIIWLCSLYYLIGLYVKIRIEMLEVL